MKARVLLLCLAVLAAWGCEVGSRSGESPDAEVPFIVTVRSWTGAQVAGATIEGGFDWDYFSIQTDADGRARLPSKARGQEAAIYRNNFFPLIVPALDEETYWIYPTPKTFRPIGEIKGWAIRFGAGTLITLEYQGGYHVYSYHDLGVAEIASAQLVSTIKETQLYGDRLWFTTHEDGVYVYSLEDAHDPRELFHLAIPGYLRPFAVNEDLIVVGNPWDFDSLRAYAYDEDGGIQLIAQFGSHNWVSKLAFLGSFLVVLDYDSLPAIYDLADPSQPVLVYQGAEPGYQSGILSGHSLALFPRAESYDKTIAYKLINLADPAHPSAAGSFAADSELFDIIDGNTAVGRYYSLYAAISVLGGNIASGFKAVSIITDNTIGIIPFHESEGSAPPYFIIGERLWKLED